MKRAAALLASLLASAAVTAQDRPVVETRAYREELARIRGALEAGDLDAVRARAAALRQVVVVADGALRYEPDASVLGPLSRAAGAPAASALRPRLSALIRSLDEAQPARPSKVDAALLESLRRQEAPGELKKGGEVGLGPLRALTLQQWALDTLDSAIKAIDEQLRRLWRFLDSLWPRRRKAGGGLDARPATLLIVCVAAATLLLLAVRVLRRPATALLEVSAGGAAAESARDADPLSREANEWELHARALEAAGKRREAIRAWYHAVLVTLFRQGLLHYEKGRTNWEYAAELPPEAAWRPAFFAITTRFDREWYGRPSADARGLREYSAEAQRILAILRRAAAA